MINFFRNIRKKLADDNRPIKYIRYAIGEIVLVVIGILIALAINNWNENRKAALQEDLYLNRLLSETNQDLIHFAESINSLEKGNQTIVLFSEAIKSEAIQDSLLLQRASDYFKYGSIYPVFTSSRSTFDDLSSTGNLKIIKNIKLREALVKYYADYEQAKELNQVAVDWALPLDAPFTVENDIMKYEPTTSFLFPEQSKQEQATEIRNNGIKYISNTAAHYWINQDAIRQLNGMIQETKALISLLNTELHIK
jgi:protein associated with RNAse G/E